MAEVVVLIPHYNTIDALIKSIKSIDEPIEIDIYIVDDGSSTKPKKSNFEFYKFGNVIIDGYKTNKGIEYALNYGLKKILKKKYDFIARLDCADTSLPNRFYKQVEFLKNNLDISFIGTWVNIVNEKGEFLYTHKTPVKHEDIKNKMYLNAMFIHPTICFRPYIIDDVGYYPTDFKAAEDFAFFFKVIKKYKTANIPEALVNVETSDVGISGSKRKQQVKMRIKIILKHFYFGFYPLYGLLRNVVLLLVSRRISTAIKKILYR
ncbi:glycosyltransferase [Flavobacteriaceae bacterium 14752]|uniref:glycosyltransferase n=1 Tax=Mesohalobacter salilacus TaxID=2491711 RepID=UPI000F63B099|nr:glycosyltransferase [Flavobacteriaceae bacterium 14752]